MIPTGWIIAAAIWTLVVAGLSYAFGKERGYYDGVNDMSQSHLE